MCGILGLIGGVPIASADLGRALALIVHRGPDGAGTWSSSDKRVHLAHRRLSILDLSDRGAQPMMDSGKRYVITYNGEIYNYLELRAELQALGLGFSLRVLIPR